MELYTFEIMKFPTCKFDFINATYVLHLEGSPRIAKVKSQLSEQPLTKLNYIMRNPGYKKVKKPLPRQNSEADIAFSHYIACKHALKNLYDKIIVLEDDFIFENELQDPDVAQKVQDFMTTSVDHYFLGCTPFMALPCSWDLTHWKVLYGGCLHAVIHSCSGMQKLVESYEKDPHSISAQ